MKLDDALLQELRTAFAAEADEYIQQATQHLLCLEEGVEAAEQAERLRELFRLAHSLKGSSRAIGLRPVGDLVHRLESLLGQIQEGARPFTPALFDLAYRTLDAIQGLVHGADEAAVGFETIQAELDQTLDGTPPNGETTSGQGDGQGGATTSPAAVTQPPQEAPGPSPVAEAENGAPVSLSTAEVPNPEAPPRGGNGAEPPGGKVHSEETVRLATGKLDALINQVGELQVLRNGLRGLVAQARAVNRLLESRERRRAGLRESARWLEMVAAQEHAELTILGGLDERRRLRLVTEYLQEQGEWLADLRREAGRLERAIRTLDYRLAQAVSGLREDVQRTRLVPLAGLFDTFPRMVRDLAQEQGKAVHFQTLGGEVEVDRAIVEQLKAPLVHLLRNAIDHGIEPPAERRAQGKSEKANLVLEASQQGDRLRIQVRDDGRGIDPGLVLRRAVERGLISAEEAEQADPVQALGLIFRPGFSTRTQVSEISGRGVGLDVVREQVERLQGFVEVDSEPGRGTTFTLFMPLTVAATRCLLIQVAGQRFAVPVHHVHRLLRAEQVQEAQAEGGPVIQVDGQPVPVADLAGLLGVGRGKGSQALVVLGTDQRLAALWVTGLEGVEELVVKPLPPPLYSVRYVAGVALLGSGEPVAVLHVGDLLREARGGARGAVAFAENAEAEVPIQTARILVVDDSATTRTLLRSILRAAGYQVEAAADGREAWERLRAEPVDLVVSDVDMPRMNGLELTRQIRQDARLERLPVILVTSLDTEEDRLQGVEAGADAYIVKGAFDQQHLLATVRQFI